MMILDKDGVCVLDNLLRELNHNLYTDLLVNPDCRNVEITSSLHLVDPQPLFAVSLESCAKFNDFGGGGLSIATSESLARCVSFGSRRSPW